jgi:VWFA-related protein
VVRIRIADPQIETIFLSDNLPRLRQHGSEGPLMRLPRPFPAFALATLACNACLAQQATAPGAQTTPAPTSSDAVLQAQATMVISDVVVTEKGKAIHGIDSKRFHVFEDGHEQALTFIEEHAPAAAGAASGFHPVPAGPNMVSNFPDTPPASAVNVLLLDGLNTPLVNQMQVRQHMLKYMDEIAPATQMAIFTLGSELRLVQGFTSNVGDLTAALKGHRSTPQPSSLVDPQADADMNSAVNDLAGMGANSDALGALQQFEAEATAIETDIRVRMTLDAMQQLARYLSAVPGRKNLIWFSGSFPLTIDPDPSLQEPSEAMRTYYEDLRETSLMLAAARVAVYPVDARGLLIPPSADASRSQTSRSVVSGSGLPSTGRGGGRSRGGGGRSNGSGTIPNPGADEANFLKQTAAEHASMQEIAEATGGKGYLNSNGLKEAVADAVENGASYYTLGYVPDRRNFHGEFRRIKVRIDNADYQLAYRAGYYADPPGKAASHNLGQTSRIVATTMHGAPPSTEVLFKARVLPSTDPAFEDAAFSPGPVGEMAATLKQPVTRYVVDFAINPHDIEFTAGDDGSHTAKIELVLLGYDSDGKRVNYLDRGFSLTLNSERFAQTEAHGIPLRMELSLPSGRGFLRIAVQDLTTGRCGSVETPLVAK